MKSVTPWIVIVALTLFGFACSKQKVSPQVEKKSQVTSDARSGDAASPSRQKSASQEAEVPSKVAGAPMHDPNHPPIDCPLRKQGLNPDHMRPFEDVEKYIAFLERPDRALWQKPDDVVAALKLDGSETVYDLGAGSGYFSFRFAKVLPLGRVIAADTQGEMVRHIHHKAMTEGITNVEAKLIQPDNPDVSPDTDVVFICDVLHHVPNRQEWLGKVEARLKPNARLVLIEFKEGELPQGPPASVKIPRAQLVELAQGAGFELETESDTLLPYQTYMVFRKPK